MTRGAGAPPTGSGNTGTTVGLYPAIVPALHQCERTGQRTSVTTSLLAEGVRHIQVSDQPSPSLNMR